MLILIVAVFYFKVLRILEGDMIMDTNYMSTPGYDVGNRSGRIRLQQQYSIPLMDGEMDDFSGKLSLENLRSAFWERDNARSTCEDNV